MRCPGCTETNKHVSRLAAAPPHNGQFPGNPFTISTIGGLGAGAPGFSIHFAVLRGAISLRLVLNMKLRGRQAGEPVGKHVYVASFKPLDGETFKRFQTSENTSEG